MSAQHTPGPWKVNRQNPNPTTGEWMICGARPGYLAEVRDCGSGDVKANARLIAAAPELLAFAQEFLKDYQSEDDMASMKHYARAAQAAIAKATVETK